MSRAARPTGLIVLILLAAHDPSDAAPPAFAAVRGDRASGWSEQTRSEVLARNGVVATSQPLAAEAGLAILKRGGNAFDAAVATAAVLNVVEPASAGIGGDVFVLAWSAKDHRLIGLNGSGRAAAGATAERIRALSSDGRVPHTGIHSATVPGAVDGWAQLLERYGTLGFRELLEPAARLAEEGFAVTERIHSDWAQGVDVLKADPDSARVYLPGGRAPETYEVFRNPDLARAFRVLETGGGMRFTAVRSARLSSPSRPRSAARSRPKTSTRPTQPGSSRLGRPTTATASTNCRQTPRGSRCSR